MWLTGKCSLESWAMHVLEQRVEGAFRISRKLGKSWWGTCCMAAPVLRWGADSAILALAAPHPCSTLGSRSGLHQGVLGTHTCILAGGGLSRGPCRLPTRTSGQGQPPKVSAHNGIRISLPWLLFFPYELAILYNTMYRPYLSYCASSLSRILIPETSDLLCLWLSP